MDEGRTMFSSPCKHDRIWAWVFVAGSSSNSVTGRKPIHRYTIEDPVETRAAEIEVFKPSRLNLTGKIF
jgi:hypothetical protein